MMSAFLLSILLNLLASVREGPIFMVCYSRRLATSVSSKLVPPSIRADSASREMRFCTTGSGTAFDLCLFYMAVRSSSKVEWCSAPMDHAYFPHDWKNSNVLDVPAQPP